MTKGNIATIASINNRKLVDMIKKEINSANFDNQVLMSMDIDHLSNTELLMANLKHMKKYLDRAKILIDML